MLYQSSKTKLRLPVSVEMDQMNKTCMICLSCPHLLILNRGVYWQQ